ncbi:hypothetical protein AS4_14560 [Acinetobacter guillouiae]|uniref:hypothetical protein n=1 Tax=Acinetobacter guillouiae TaxID=106649 RepID=UPI0004EF5FAD|nr:hypothetical protein [Acinetobacter guillouiae]BAP36396.1 hypothetical protein AS4_14560 [Acinetobacter guillouiae]
MRLLLLKIALVTLFISSTIKVQAGLTIPMGFTASDSVHTFPETLRRDFWVQLGIKAEAKGTATPIDEPNIGGNPTKFNYPITSIVIGSKMKIILGRAKGTVMVYSRIGEDGNQKSLTLSNFSIDYIHNYVLADATYGKDKRNLQLPVFTFNVEQPLKFHYQLPIGFKSDEKLDNLYLTPQAKIVYQEALALPDAAIPLLELDFGTLTQKSSSKLRFK